MKKTDGKYGIDIKTTKDLEKYIRREIEKQIKIDVKEYFDTREFIQLNQE